MANALPFNIFDADGNRVTGAAAGCVVSGWVARTLDPHPAPLVAEVTGGYVLEVSDEDELLGTVFLVDTGAGRRKRYVVLGAYLPSNQFFAVPFTDADGALWAGAAPTLTWSGATVPDVATPTAGVYIVVPSGADIAGEDSGTLTAPVGAFPEWYFLEVDALPSTVSPFVSSGISPEAVATQALADWLRLKLPAKCAALNSNRAAQLKSAVAGPFAIADDCTLRLSVIGTEDATPYEVAVPAGIYTAAQLAFLIDATATSIDASEDFAGRLVLQSEVTPTEDAPSVVAVLAAEDDASAAAHAALGWEAGGERVDCAAVISPGYRNVVDGDWLVAPDAGSGFIVRLLDRQATVAYGDARHGEFWVDVTAEVWRPFGANVTPHRDRDAIETCLRAVREVVTDDSTGRQLGRAAAGDIMRVDITTSAVSGETFFANGVSFEAAALTFRIRVFQPPSGP